MTLRRYSRFAILLFLCSAIGCGCSGYGKAKPESVGREAKPDSAKRVFPAIKITPTETVTIEELKADWLNYSIYYADVFTIGPAVLLFDPKQDGKTLQAEDWSKIETQKTLLEVVDNIRRGIAPKLFSIMATDGRLCGYVFYAFKHQQMEIYLSIKSVAPDTLRVAGTSARGYAPP